MSKSTHKAATAWKWFLLKNDRVISNKDGKLQYGTINTVIVRNNTFHCHVIWDKPSEETDGYRQPADFDWISMKEFGLQPKSTSERADGLKKLLSQVTKPNNNSGRKKQLLIVDDTLVQVMSMKRHLNSLSKEMNFEIVSAANGRSGLEMVQKSKPDLILLDLEMPIMNGIEMLEILKSDPSTENIPVVIVSTHKSLESYNLGRASYIGKPFDPKDLCDKVARYINPSRRFIGG